MPPARRIHSTFASPRSLAATCTAGALLLTACFLGPGLVRGAIAAPAAAATPQDRDDDLLDRPISRLEFVGLERTDRQLVENNIRAAIGQPFDPTVIAEDVSRLYRLGRFDTVDTEVELLDDGTVSIVYRFGEQLLIGAIEVTGNRLVDRTEIMSSVPLYAGGPRDSFLIEQSLARVKSLYRERGHYLAEVSIDESRLADEGVLVLRVVEGPRVRIKSIEFAGNENIASNRLKGQIASKSAIPILRKGELDPDRIIDDVAALDRFYKDNGFVDVRVDSRIQLSPDNKEVRLTYVIDEGRQYRLRNVIVRALSPDAPITVFNAEQLRALMTLRTGDTFERRRLDDSLDRVRGAYELLGYVDVQVRSDVVRVGEEPEVDLLLGIFEAEPVIAGAVRVQGNFITRDKVIRRQIRIQPGRPLDGRQIDEATKRLRSTQLFGDVRVTVQEPDSRYRTTRDVLVEVKERNTGSVNFGAGLGSDSGIFGEISITQNNFDVTDVPVSFDELFRARAFRGAGQQFSLRLAPGDEISTYLISLAEPHLFDTDISGNVSAFYRTRVFEDYDEERVNFTVGAGRRLGDIWQIAASVRFERVVLTDFQPSTPIEVVADQGPDQLAGVRLSLTRTTVDDFFRPGRGSRLELGLNQTFLLDRDDQFTSVDGSFTTFLTIDEDLLGRRSTLRLNTRLGYIFGDNAPIYERFYLGGRSLRGFEFRTVSPKNRGTIADPAGRTGEPVGGKFLFFAGAQYEFPIVGNSFNGVLFCDSGTVTNDFELDPYRVSVGLGVRFYLPALGPAPLAFDFGFPIVKDELDRGQTFSFTAELPF